MTTKKKATESTATAAEGTEPASYAAAELELDTILRSMEDDDVDVDQLSAQVARARHLIGWCRSRLAAAEVTITDLLEDESPPTADS